MTLGRSQSAAPLPVVLPPGLGLEPEGPAPLLGPVEAAAGGVAVAGVAGEEDGDEPDMR